MKKLIFINLLLFFSTVLFAQNFFREDFDAGKKYILLANPTVNNIETINFLLNKKLLKINPRKVNFVGVYHENQNYDFTETSRFIEKSDLDYFKLHEIRGDLNENQLFEQNSISDDLNNIFQNSVGIFFFGGADIPPSAERLFRIFLPKFTAPQTMKQLYKRKRKTCTATIGKTFRTTRN
ncbi:MAG: hypothetical protein LC658_03400 [Bacteroidales bacterium]|nr:hypothetical protein [Bacteroidales bacterium]